MSKLVMNSENEIPLRHEFVCSGFIERAASWARFLCLVFLFLQLLATAVNLIYPFAVEPPPFYIQLLFFLLACAAFEIFAIPIEAVKDHCIIDLQKTMVVKIYNRYFFTRVEVLATFDKIKNLGVSARPAPAIKGAFSESPNRFAILMLTEKGRVHRLTDYTLGLEEANKLLKSLHESYLRNTDIVYGAENNELCLDRHVDKSFVPRPCQRSWLTLIDAALIPAFQAAVGAVVVVVLIGITAVVGDFISDRMFNTSLKITHQPIVQIVMTPKRQESVTLVQDKNALTAALPPAFVTDTDRETVPGQKSAGETATAPALPVETSSKPEQIIMTVATDAASSAANLSQNSPQQLSSSHSTITTTQEFKPAPLNTPEKHASVASQTAEPNTQQAKEQTVLASAFPSEPPAADFITIVDHEEDSDPPHAMPEPATPIAPVPTDVKASADRSAKIQVNNTSTDNSLATTVVDAAEVAARSTPPKKAATADKITTTTSADPVLVPLPSRIPTFDEAGFAQPATAVDSSAQPIRLRVPPQTVQQADKEIHSPEYQPRPAVAKIEQAATPSTSDSEADSADAKDRLVAMLADKLAKAPRKPARNPAATASNYLGQNIALALDSLGKPLTSIKTAGGEQLIYSGITLLTDSSSKKIIQVNLTGQQNKTLGALATREGLKVGGRVSDARSQLGVPMHKANSPGLHFPARGISVFPLPGDSETIGSIQVYQSSAQTGQ